MKKQLGNRKTAKHLYDVEVIKEDGTRETWEVFANNRDQARRIAEQWNVTAASVNMVG